MSEVEIVVDVVRTENVKVIYLKAAISKRYEPSMIEMAMGRI